MIRGALPDSVIAGSAPRSGLSAILTGPTSTSVRFTTGTSRIWGVGMLPLGWARFVGAPAHLFADRIIDVATDPTLAAFRPLVANVFGPEPVEAGELARITA